MFCFFFFSSRRRHTRWTGDWSSDVCSSDLDAALLRMVATLLELEPEQRRDHTQQRGVRLILAARPPAQLADRGVRDAQLHGQIGRASCRERVEVSGGDGSFKKKKNVVAVRG